MPESPKALLMRSEQTVRAALLGRAHLDVDDSILLVARRAITTFRLAQRVQRLKRLDPPTREALRFLESVTHMSGDKATPAHRRPAGASGRHIIRGLRRWLELRLRDLENPEIESSQIVREVAVRHERLEALIMRNREIEAQLSDSARAIRGWCAYFRTDEHVAAYRRCAGHLGRLLAEHRPARSRWPSSVVVMFGPSRSLWRMRAVSGRAYLTLPTGMIGFNDRQFEALARMIHGMGGRATVVQAMLQPPYQAIERAMERYGGACPATRGDAHDLGDSFHRVNAAYFAGHMARPRLAWSRTESGRKFGHYEFARDSLVISRRLDDPAIPSWLLDFVMYHELLHKRHGLRWVNGRGLAHTAAFREDERRFERYQEAEAMLQRLSRPGRASRGSNGSRAR